MSARRILIIGAGLAGLVAALELEQRGHHVRVAEASSRVGGRIRTWSPGPPESGVGELGAMRIPAQHETVLAYVRKAGLERDLVPFASAFATTSGWFSRGGAAARWSDAEDRLFGCAALAAPTPRRIGRETRCFAQRLQAMFDAVAPAELRRRFDAELDGALLEALDGLDLRPFLDARRPRVDLGAFFARHPDVLRYFSATTTRFLHDVALETQPELYTLASGMERLPRALAERLRRPPLLETPVRRIERRREDVLAHVEGHGEMRFDWVICTAPFSALRHLELRGLSHDKMDLIRAQRYCPTVKALFWCREPFWHADGVSAMGGASCVDGPIRQIYYPAARAGSTGAVLLATYATGADARALTAMSPGDRLSHVRREAARLHPELDAPGMIRDAVFIDWDAEPWIRGGCSVPWRDDAGEPNGLEADAHLGAHARAAARPEGRLLFAGEHCSVHPAWLEGAARSALDAVACVS